MKRFADRALSLQRFVELSPDRCDVQIVLGDAEDLFRVGEPKIDERHPREDDLDFHELCTGALDDLFGGRLLGLTRIW
jgi:hypothetical protein